MRLLKKYTRNKYTFSFAQKYQKPKDTKLIDPSLLTVFRRTRLTDSKDKEGTKTATKLMDKLQMENN